MAEDGGTVNGGSLAAGGLAGLAASWGGVDGCHRVFAEGRAVYRALYSTLWFVSHGWVVQDAGEDPMKGEEMVEASGRQEIGVQG